MGSVGFTHAHALFVRTFSRYSTFCLVFLCGLVVLVIMVVVVLNLPSWFLSRAPVLLTSLPDSVFWFWFVAPYMLVWY